MSKIYRSLLFLVLIAALQSCTHYTLVGPGKVKIDGFYSIETRIGWSKHEKSKMQSWTVDGPLLHGILFINGVSDGEPLILVAGKDEEDLPKFKTGMTPLELRELFVASLSAAKAQSVKVTQLKPAKFGKLSGFRFAYNYLTKNGLEMKGIGIGVVHKDRLYAISYAGAKLYYFDKNKDDVEMMFKSIKII